MPYDQEEQEEEIDHEVDDNKKVFVSRLPFKWTEKMLQDHFQSCFGEVISATIKWDTKNECSLGYGFVVFKTEESRNTAVEQGSLHAKKKTIQIRAVEREESTLGRGRDTGICYLWQRSACVKGKECIFLHEGVGACVTVSAFGEGKLKKCMSFKSKGKCSKGDTCPFLHVVKPAIASNKKKESKEKNKEKGKETNKDIKDKNKNEDKVTRTATGKIKYCHTFQKTGKCRKGEKCMFSHSSEWTVATESSDDIGNTLDSSDISKTKKKRQRIDGDELVKRKKTAEAI